MVEIAAEEPVPVKLGSSNAHVGDLFVDKVMMMMMMMMMIEGAVDETFCSVCEFLSIVVEKIREEGFGKQGQVKTLNH